MTWQPIETANDESVGIFYLDWADDAAKLNIPIEQFYRGIPEYKWRYHFGKNRSYGSGYKATHWQLLPQPPQTAGDERD